jgi:hypothetical protein
VFGTLVGIQIIKFLPRRIKEFIFGKNNSAPMTNFISILINGSQHTVLIKNSSRYILLMFMVWSLIIR